MNLKSICPQLLGIFMLVACSSASTSPPNAPPASNTPTDDDDTATTRDALEFVAPCAPSTCGEVPSSSKSAKPACTPSDGSCGWSDPNGTVSFRQCGASECGAEPDASVCPAGTTKKGATCGSENDGPCTWRTACAYPRSTTPCPTESECGPMPLLGVICKDGSNGELLCMKKGASCDWQPSCE